MLFGFRFLQNSRRRLRQLLRVHEVDEEENDDNNKDGVV